MSRIIRLQAENIKRLRAVEISPTGNIVEITGRNGQGKTSTLDAIMWALGGAKYIPSRPIRDGEKAARVLLDIGDEQVEVIVELRITESGARLEVRTPEGAKHPKAQSKLNDLVGALSFDPLAFTRQKSAEQAETLRRLAGVNFTDLDAEFATLYQARRDHNRDAAALKSQLAGVRVADPKAKPVDVADLTARFAAAREQNAKRQAADAAVLRAATDARRAGEYVEQLEAQLAKARKDYDDAKAVHSRLSDEAQAFEVVDTTEIETALSTAAQKNQQAALVKQADEIRAKLEKVEKLAQAADDRMEAIKDEKASSLAAAKLPIEGLGITGDSVTYNGIPFDQCSAAEQLKVSVAMGLALNPKLRVILVRDGSLLDADSMAVLSEMAEAHNAQIWVESVAHGEPRGFVIEDGQVQE